VEVTVSKLEKAISN